MRKGIFMLLLAGCTLVTGEKALAIGPSSTASDCTPAGLQQQYSSGVCTAPDNIFFPVSGGPEPLPVPGGSRQEKINQLRPAKESAGQTKDAAHKTIIYFFWGKGCAHCEEEHSFLTGLQARQQSLEIRSYEVWYHKTNAALLAGMLRAHGAQFSGVPVTFVGDQFFAGFTPRTRILLEEKIKECSLVPCVDPAALPGKNQPERVGQLLPFTAATSATTDVATLTIPFLGNRDMRNSSLPLMTLVIAGMDSFNPCAFFVLLTLLGLLTHAQSRNRMLLIGSLFVFFSGSVYFLFMAAWLNLFLVIGHIEVITRIAGWVSLVIAGINIKDFFLFKQGVSLTIPDKVKPKLFARMRSVLRADSVVSLLIGTSVLAIVANSYELLCTAGFPMVYTRLLTLKNLSPASFYLYLFFYNLVYVVPLFSIVLCFSLTLGRWQLSPWQGRVLKLASGAMMLGLGVVLLVNPALLNSLLVSFVILLSALGGSLLVAMATRKWGASRG